ncbi:MAG TPA: MarR family transcriptional regulator [Actinomycetales bacterium]|nr:MarR family transcriptional regulator [Actinomycetales bacterium]
MSSAAPSADPVVLAAQLRLALGRLARELRHSSAAGVTPSQLSALANLEEAGALRLGDLAAREGVTPSTTSRTVDALESSGFVERRPDPEDGRATRIAPTASGRELLTSLRTRRDALLSKGIERLPDDRRRALRAAVPALVDLVEALRAD